MAGWNLVQVNVARLRAPIDSAELAPFVAALDPLNELAEASPGFVWRLQTEDGNATSIHIFDDDMILVNMSVWESVEALADYVYRSDHVEIMKRRREFFERMAEAYLALWWIPADTLPDVTSVPARLATLRERGPSLEAFTFRESFPPPGESTTTSVDDTWKCPTG